MKASSRPELNWFLPLGTDVRHIGTWPPEGEEPRLHHLVQVTEAAEQAGFAGLLVPTAYVNEAETWTAASAVLARTRSAKLILAVRPNQLHPAQAAKMTATLDYLFPGRVALNVVTGGWGEDRWIGCYDDRETRYQRVREWLEIVTQAWAGADRYQGMTYAGKIYQLDGLSLYPPPDHDIPIYLSGSSAPARQLSAEFADAILIWADLPDAVAAEVSDIRQRYAARRRAATVLLRVHVVVRESEEAAWREADELISRVDPRVRETIEARSFSDSPGRDRQTDLGTGDLMVGPNLWAGPGTGRFGVATALVGDPSQIVDRLMEYRAAGVDGFILSGYPKLREARQFGRLVTRLFLDTDRARRRDGQATDEDSPRPSPSTVESVVAQVP
ncbi:MAG: alkanesulfonate monooxygenase [Micromonosporaceae bacterium]